MLGQPTRYPRGISGVMGAAHQERLLTHDNVSAQIEEPAGDWLLVDDAKLAHDGIHLQTLAILC